MAAIASPRDSVRSLTAAATTPGDALTSAILSSDVERAGRMLLSGVNVDSCDSDGFTPVHRCVAVESSQMLNFFLQKGASAQLSDKNGDTPLHFVAYTGHIQHARFLIEFGANPHVPNSSGKTAVQAAAEEGEWALVLLVARTVGEAPAGSPALASPAVPAEAVAAAERRLARANLVGVAGANAVAILPPEPLALLTQGGGSLMSGLAKGSMSLLKSMLGKPAGAPATTMRTDGNGLPPPSIVSGLDFSRGIILHGPLQKKRANKVLSWRPKYYVASALFGAIFFWTGTKSEVEGVIKKVRFETFFSVTHLPDKRGGRRFNLRVISGRTMNLAAGTPEEGLAWVAAIKGVAGRLMAAARIQAVWRGHTARQRMRKEVARRGEALAAVTGGSSKEAQGKDVTVKSAKAGLGGFLAKLTGSKAAAAAAAAGAAGGAGGAGGKDDEEDDEEQPGGPVSADGVIIEGELRKKNHSFVTSLVSAYRTRYFVLHRTLGALIYYETKAKRTMGVKARRIPFAKLVALGRTGVAGAPTPSSSSSTGAQSPGGGSSSSSGGGLGFYLRLTSGKLFNFEARSVEDADNWVKSLRSVLVVDNMMALRIQTAWRRSGYKRWRKSRLAASGLGSSSSSSATPAAAAGGGLMSPAPNPLPPPLTPSSRGTGKRERWMEKREAGGKPYYANLDTNETVWEMPPAIASGAVRLVVGPYFSRTDGTSGKKYYVHLHTNATSWERPAGYVSEGEEEAGRGGAPPPPPSLAPPPPPPPAAFSPASSSRSRGGSGFSSTASGASTPAALAAAKPRDIPTALRIPRNSTSHTRCGAFLAAVRERAEWAGWQAGSSASAAAEGGQQQQLASEAALAAAGWCELLCERSGRPVYVHAATGASQYSRPSGSEAFAAAGEADTGVSNGVYTPRGSTPSSARAGGSGSAGAGAAHECSLVGLTHPRACDPNELLSLTLWVNSTVPGCDVATDGDGLGGGAHPLVSALADAGFLARVLTTALSSSSASSSASPSAFAPAALLPSSPALSLAGVLNAATSEGIPLPRHVTAPALLAGTGAAALDCLYALARHRVVGGGCAALLGSSSSEAGGSSSSSSSAASGGVARSCLLVEGEGQPPLSPPEALLLRWAALAVRSWPGPPLAPRLASLGAAWASGELLCALLHGLRPAFPADTAASLLSDIPASPAALAAHPGGAVAAIEACLSSAFTMGVPPMYTVAAFSLGNARLQALFLGHLVAALPSAALGLVGAGGSSGASAAAAFSPFLCPGAAAPTASAGLALAPPSAPLPLPDSPPTASLAPIPALPATASAPSAAAAPSAAQLSDARLIRAWVASLGLQGLTLPPFSATPRALARAASDGVLLLRLLDAVEPGAVAWGLGAVYTRPATPPQCRANAEAALAVAKAMDLPGVARLTPGDITSGANVGAVLGLLLGLARAHLLARISRGAFAGASIDEAAVLAWANELVEGAASAAGVGGGEAGSGSGSGAAYVPAFSALATSRGGGLPLALLMAALGTAVDWQVVRGGAGAGTGRAGELAQYLLSLAARSGACLLPTAAELQEGSPRPCAFLVLSLLAAAVASA